MDLGVSRKGNKESYILCKPCKMVLNSSITDEVTKASHLSSEYHLNAQQNPPIFVSLPKGVKSGDVSYSYICFPIVL